MNRSLLVGLLSKEISFWLIEFSRDDCFSGAICLATARPCQNTPHFVDGCCQAYPLRLCSMRSHLPASAHHLSFARLISRKIIAAICGVCRITIFMTGDVFSTHLRIFRKRLLSVCRRIERF